MPMSRTWGIVALGAAAFLVALCAGFALAPNYSGGSQEPYAHAVGTPANAEAKRHAVPADAVQTPRTLVQKERSVAALKSAVSATPFDPQTAAGEVLGGLQIVVHVDKVVLEPGETLNVSWKIVNHLNSSVQYLDVKPAIVITKEGWRSSYIAAGRNRPATPEDLKQIGANGTMAYDRNIEWPKPVPHAPPDWPDYSRPGTYKLTVGFMDDPSIPAVAKQLLQENHTDVYRQPLISGTLTITVKGDILQAPETKTSELINEEF